MLELDEKELLNILSAQNVPTHGLKALRGVRALEELR
jgi:hypothetical protein